MPQVKQQKQRPPRAASPTDDGNGQKLIRGSEVEMGRWLLTEMRDDGPRLVFDRGAFYRYDGRQGIWSKVPEHLLEQQLHGLDGAMTPGGQLGMTHRKVIGALKCAAAEVTNMSFFDDAPAGLAFKNGFVTVDAKRGVKLHALSPEHRAAIALPFDYVAGVPPGAKWNAYLGSVFSGDDDGDQKIRLLQQFVGACLIGRATSFQKALVLQGLGGDGKSVFIKVVQALFPAHAVTAIPPQEFDEPYSRALLAGVRLNCVSEMPEDDVLSSAAFKAIVTGDRVMARNPTERPFFFVPIAGQMFAANNLFSSTDHSRGFWQRFVLCKFNNLFRGTDGEVLDLDKELIATELPYVASWALAGAADLLRRGHYDEPASSSDALSAWRRASDQVQSFVEERLRVTVEPQLAGSVLYEEYARWSRANNFGALNSNKFAARLSALPLGIRRTKLEAGNFWNVELR